jgi:penicillin-binding protein 1A
MSRQSRKRRQRHRGDGASRVLIVGGGALAAALVVATIAAVAYVLNVAREAPALNTLRPILGGGSSQVFASDGTRLGFIRSDLLRSPVGWSEIPVNMKEATVAIEDQRFYKHNGVDLTGIFRAAIKDLTNGAALQGGSTITMQLMRNLYLGGDQHTLRQKIIEAKLALDYEKVHGKRYILTAYLNSVPYGTVGGQTAVGVQAAARIFFDKPASQLSLGQSALLAGLPQAPSQYNPFRDPSAARARRNEVLSKMAELHYISGAEASAAESAPLEVHLGHFYSQRREDFFFEYVREQLEHRYGKKTVEQGGLKVYTTLDLHMQELARKSIAGVLGEPEDPSAAIVTLNPHNGDIEAMAESESYSKSQYNLAADGHRQPGSTWKAIDLADALSRGVDPNSTIYDSHTLSPGWLQGYPTYEVKTFGGEQNGAINLVSATLKSDNTVYAQLAADLGEETITQMAYKMGVTTHLSSFPAEALGGLTLGVTPLEMAVVYSTLANGGWRDTPIAITKVVFPDGHADESWGRPHRVKVLSEAITGEETSILHKNVQGGTAVRSAINCPTAAKTGTTSELVDAWLDGYNAEYSTVVWMGYPNRRVSMTDVHGEPQQGGALPAQIWHDYMSAVTEGAPCASLHENSTGISYTPFYGKYATTGQGSGGEETGEAQTPFNQGSHNGNGGNGNGRGNGNGIGNGNGNGNGNANGNGNGNGNATHGPPTEAPPAAHGPGAAPGGGRTGGASP